MRISRGLKTAQPSFPVSFSDPLRSLCLCLSLYGLACHISHGSQHGKHATPSESMDATHLCVAFPLCLVKMYAKSINLARILPSFLNQKSKLGMHPMHSSYKEEKKIIMDDDCSCSVTSVFYSLQTSDNASFSVLLRPSHRLPISRFTQQSHAPIVAIASHGI